MLKPTISMRHALTLPDMFGDLLPGETWLAWRILLIAMFGEVLTDEEREIFKRLTGRIREPGQLVETFVGVIGRRGGKSRAMAIAAAFIAALCDHREKVVPGERPLVLCLAQNQRQAQVAFGYVVAVFETVAVLRGMIANKTSDTLVLTNGVSIEVRAASFRGLRGVTCLAVLADETCFWHSEETSGNADSEILAAVRPSLATTGGPLIMISSPYSKRGETYELWARHFGPDGDPLVLVAQGASRDFNPSLPQRVVDRALEADPEAAAAEYLGQWRSDISAFVDRRAVDACVVDGRFELVRQRGVLNYVASIDPSGGSSDSMTLSIAHAEGDVVILDLVREVRPPFDPDAVCAEFAAIMRAYGVFSARGDRYAGAWVSERMKSHGIDYQPAELTTTQLYSELLPLLMSRRVALLDNERLIGQLCALERRVGRSGKDNISHPPGQHDDIVTSAAGAIYMAARGEERLVSLSAYLGPDGGGVAVPRPVTLVFATAFIETSGANIGRAGVAYFADGRLYGLGLTLLDFETGLLSDALLRGVATRLAELADATLAQRFAFFADRSTLRRFEPIGHASGDGRAMWDVAPELDQHLPAAASAHVTSGGVRITNDALLKAQSTPLADALSFEFGRRTELSVALMLGIAAAYEQGSAAAA